MDKLAQDPRYTVIETLRSLETKWKIWRPLYVAQDLSYEHESMCFFATIRTIGSRLWFINNPELDERIRAYLARYQEKYQVKIYAFVQMGNHYHLLARFPQRNKAAFFRSFNAIIAKLTASRVELFESGKLWARRVRVQAVPRDEDILKQFLYCALNPVAAGICRRLRDYKSYNSFSDAIYDRQRTYKIVNWQRYNNLKRKCPTLKPRDCETTHTLKFSRLPGFESLGKSQYVRRMLEAMEEKRGELVQRRLSEKKGFATVESLKKQKVGAKPGTTKSSKRDTHRPLVLTSCLETKQTFLDWYFGMLGAFKLASHKFRNGIAHFEFPPGTYLPTRMCS